MTSPKKEGDGKMMCGNCPQRKANSVRGRQGSKKGKRHLSAVCQILYLISKEMHLQYTITKQAHQGLEKKRLLLFGPQALRDL